MLGSSELPAKSYPNRIIHFIFKVLINIFDHIFRVFIFLAYGIGSENLKISPREFSCFLNMWYCDLISHGFVLFLLYYLFLVHTNIWFSHSVTVAQGLTYSCVNSSNKSQHEVTNKNDEHPLVKTVLAPFALSEICLSLACLIPNLSHTHEAT